MKSLRLTGGLLLCVFVFMLASLGETASAQTTSAKADGPVVRARWPSREAPACEARAVRVTHEVRASTDRADRSSHREGSSCAPLGLGHFERGRRCLKGRSERFAAAMNISLDLAD